jgi:hypothetical protein
MLWPSGVHFFLHNVLIFPHITDSNFIPVHADSIMMDRFIMKYALNLHKSPRSDQSVLSGVGSLKVKAPTA